MRIKNTQTSVCFFKYQTKKKVFLNVPTFFLKMYTFWKSINYCCTLVVMAKQQKIWSTKCVFWSRMRGGGSEKPKRAGSRSQMDVSAPQRFPTRIPAAMLSATNVIFFYVSSGFSAAKCSTLQTDRQTDRQTLWKFDCNPSASPLVCLRGCLLRLSDEMSIYSLQNKQTNKQKMSVDWLFCTLVVL